MSFTDVPSYFATATGMNETASQIILSIFVIFLILLPYIILTKGKPSPFISLILVFMGESLTLALGWSPFWIMIMFLALTAAGVAVLGAKGVTGG